MARTFTLIALVFVLLGQATSARADWHACWARFKLDFKRMNCWPEPFVTTDRSLTREPITRMVRKGWQRQTTLGDHHFHPETHQLNEAGELMVRWVMTQAPTARRHVHVLRGDRPEESEVRLDSVQQFIVRSMPNYPLPPVVATDIEPPGWPAEYVNAIDNKSHDSIPAPRLPAQTGLSGGN